ncbi:MAG TPA: FmdB family zinc ribbon protein [Ramlibacter sp.]|jgi:putative FmdB family regulatory protein
MPIYAYKCASCGFAKDVLQKISDAPLKDCPQCGAPAFSKQVTAAGFQLKGSGWYATDFRGGSTKPAEKSTDAPADAGKTDAGKTDAGKTESKPAETSAPKPDAPAAAGGCGASCACH